jgi:hypothetical protein
MCIDEVLSPDNDFEATTRFPGFRPPWLEALYLCKYSSVEYRTTHFSHVKSRTLESVLHFGFAEGDVEKTEKINSHVDSHTYSMVQ